jgi:hypothetical protein
VNATAPDDNVAFQLIRRVSDFGIAGVKLGGIQMLPSAQALAENYRRDAHYPHHEARIDALIRWQAAKNFTAGFMTNLGGMITLPIAIPAAMGASWIIQANMAAAVTCLRGYDIEDDRVRTFVMMTLLADGARQALNQVSMKASERVTRNLIMQIPGQVLKDLNKQVGFRLLTKAGQKGVINLIKFVPLVSGVVGGAIDGTACLGVGQAAKYVFPMAEEASDPFNWSVPNTQEV